MVFVKQGDRGAAHRVTDFVSHFPCDHHCRRQPQHQGLCIQPAAGDYACPKILVLLVGVSEESSLRALQRIFSGSDLKLEFAVVGGRHGLVILGILGVGD